MSAVGGWRESEPLPFACASLCASENLAKAAVLLKPEAVSSDQTVQHFAVNLERGTHYIACWAFGSSTGASIDSITRSRQPPTSLLALREVLAVGGRGHSLVADETGDSADGVPAATRSSSFEEPTLGYDPNEGSSAEEEAADSSASTADEEKAASSWFFLSSFAQTGAARETGEPHSVGSS